MRHRHGLSFFVWVSAILVALGLLTTSTARAATTGNRWVTAQVDGATGLITILDAMGSGQTQVPPGRYITFPQHSYLTLKVDGQKYYTNNFSPTPTFVSDPIGSPKVTLTFPYPIVNLDNGTTKKITGIPGTPDTVRTVWPEDGFDIVQDVYAVAFQTSGQIVMKVRIVNHSGSSHSVQAQFLNDLEAFTADNAFMLSRLNYIGQSWLMNTNPSFYLETQNNLNTLNPGEIGVGFMNDSFPPGPMGLIQPSAVVFGDWGVFQTFAFGVNSNSGGTNDAAVLLQWGTVGISGNSGQPDTVTEIMRTSFGTDEICKDVGNAVAFSFFPTHLVYDQKTRKYSPNPFKVLSIIVNPSSSAGTSVKLTQSVTAPLLIKDAVTKPITPPGGGTISGGNMMDFEWTDSVGMNVGCNGQPTDAQVSFTLSAAGINQPFFSNGNTTSPCPIVVDCGDVDTVAPIVFNLDTSRFSGGHESDTFQVHDGATTDFGMQRISWEVINNRNASNFTIGVTPPAGTPPVVNGGDIACPKGTFNVRILQKDTTLDGCVHTWFIDCAGNRRDDTLCFDAHPIPGRPDTYKPEFMLERLDDTNIPPNLGNGCSDTSNSKCTEWRVTDTINHKYGHGLGSIGPMAGAVNMTFQNSAFANAADTAYFEVCVMDSMQDGSIIIEAVDTAKNIAYDTIHFCTVPDTTAPIIHPYTTPAPHTYHFHITDSGPWQRGLDSVFLVPGFANVHTIPDSIPNPMGCPGPDHYDFDVIVKDTFQVSSFQVGAIDCAGHRTISGPFFTGADTDTHAPVLTVTWIDSGHTHMRVVVSDSSDNFEEGVDSVWFTNVDNMILTPINPPGTVQTIPAGSPFGTTFNPSAIHGRSFAPKTHPAFQQSIVFELQVADTSNVPDTMASVTICALDGARYRLSGGCYTWGFPMQPDSMPPQITGTNPTCKSVDIAFGDRRPLDRGLSEVKLSNAVNFKPFDDAAVGGQGIRFLTLNVTTPGKSAYGDLWTLDEYGKKNPGAQGAHTAAGSLWIYVQDLQMQAAHVFLDSGVVTVPIMIDKSDSIQLNKKNLKQLQFTFHLTGSDLINLVSVVPGTFATGWTASATPSGPPSARTYIVNASGPALPAWDAKQDTILVLKFHADFNSSTGETNIVIDTIPCGTMSYAISYNGGQDTTLFGLNSQISIPAPFGNLNGGTLTLKGACSPFISEHGLPPTAISLRPITPNPATKGTSSLHIEYTVPADAPVTINLFNALGVQVRTIVSETQKQGEYQLDVPAADLPQGIYFVRLQSGGGSCLRRVVLGE